MSDAKRRNCELDAATISFFRRNPCIAAEELLGIKLLDSQKYILQSSWNAQYSVWCCSRNFGKSFLGAVFMILKALLYENQGIYIVSSVGDQAKQTFEKIEELVTGLGQTAASFRGLKDIPSYETVKNSSCKTGFSHNPAGFEVSFYNGSSIQTLNSKPDSARSRRATLVFFDEAAFCSEELILVCEAFATQNTSFTTSVDADYNPELEATKVPTQLIYASSQDTMDTRFYSQYKECAKQMLAGNRDYFCADMICDTAIQVYLDGKPYTPLLTQEKVDAALQQNEYKALREYYNQPTRDGGVNQIIKWNTIRKNEELYVPYIDWRPNNRIVLAFDPARTNDNSIITAMNLEDNPELGLCGRIVSCQNLVDTSSKNKIKLDSNRQLEALRETLLAYNGDNPDYEYIDSLYIDAGAGGGGVVAYADGLLNDWTDKHGKTHAGLIDKTNELYQGYSKRYPNAIDKLRVINPKKYRTIMIEELIELMDLGVIKLPIEYSGQEFLRFLKDEVQKGEQEFDTYYLSMEEKQNFSQIDMLKIELASIHEHHNTDKTSKTYALAKDKENRLHDDRFYTIALLAHRLYELRRGSQFNKEKPRKDISRLVQMRPPKMR